MAKIIKTSRLNILLDYHENNTIVTVPYKEIDNSKIHVITEYNEIKTILKKEKGIVINKTLPIIIVKQLARELCFIDGYAYDYSSPFFVVQYPVINQDNICNKCNGIGKPSKAFINIHNIQTQDASKEFETKLIDCIKCEDCGHSWK